MNRINEVEISKARCQILKEFIQLYKSYPCLWKVKSKEYHNKDKRNKAYKAMVQKLQQIHPDADRPAVVRKINSLRSNVRKEAKKHKYSLEAGKVYKSKLWYYHHFDFLNDVSQQQQAECKEPSVVSVKTEDSKSDPLEWEYEVETESCAVEDYDKDTNTMEEETCEPTFEVEALPPSTTRSLHDNSYNRSLVNDMYDVFGQNVAMKLRHISSTNDSQRIMAEKIINEAIYMAEMGMLTMEHCNLLK